MQPLISVIIPIYNVEKYLNNCIKSVVNQSYNNLEIILVDDGSSDNCGKICDEWAIRDIRVNVIHKKNGGLSDARNVGISYAKGEYITLIDSDDYISIDYIEYLYNLLKENNADISICNPFYVYENSKEKIDDRPNEQSMVKCMKSIEALNIMLYQNYYDTSAWGKLYKTELFKGISYPVGKLFEDLGTTYKLFLKADSIVFGNAEKYYYIQRSNSISNNKFNYKKLDYLYFAEEIHSYATKYLPQIKDAAASRCISVVGNILLQLPNHSDYLNLKKELYRNILGKRNGLLKNKDVRKKNKVIILISYFPFNIFMKIFNIISKHNKRMILKK